MKKNIKSIIGVALVFVFVLVACRKIELPNPQIIDLGVQSTTTKIKSVTKTDNIFTTEFYTTPGAKYSIQIIPFGTDVAVKKDGFTATDSITKKIYNLSDLKRMDYDLIFIDINGKEVKHPILIK